MKKIRPILLGTVGLLIVLILAGGCYRPAAPDVTATPAADTESAESEEPTEPAEEDPDMLATGAANATLAAGGEEESEETATEEPTEVSPTSTPTAEPTAVPEEATPAPTAEPTAVPEEATPAPSESTTHVVQPGENLFRIALRYNMTTEALAQANGIANPRLIYVGQKLTIPAGAQPSPPSGDETTYVVQPGDNLFRIALRYNMSYLYLAQHNGITNPSHIYVGQVLSIPPR